MPQQDGIFVDKITADVPKERIRQFAALEDNTTLAAEGRVLRAGNDESQPSAQVRVLADDADRETVFGATKTGTVTSKVLSSSAQGLTSRRKGIILCYPSVAQSHPPVSLSCLTITAPKPRKTGGIHAGHCTYHQARRQWPTGQVH